MKLIKFSPDIDKQFKILQRKDIKLFNKINQKIKLFKQNPKHKSLRLHKIKRGRDSVWSISIDKSYRMLFKENHTYFFFDFGTHDQVYRK